MSIDLAPLARALGVAPERLDPLATDGLVHDHVRLQGRGLLRIPRFSQVAPDGAGHLAYEASCFRRAHASGCTPRLIETFAPARGLPCGALLVEEITGRRPVLPADMAPIALSLACLHRLPVPPPHRRAPLLDDGRDPFGAALRRLQEQARLLPDLPPPLARRLASLAPTAAPQSLALIATDCHPGNFLVDPAGRAVLLDLERMQYGSPAMDLAHAASPAATLWGTGTVLGDDDAAAFYRAYRAAIDAKPAAQLRPWLLPFRRLVALRTAMWFLRFERETAAGRWDVPAERRQAVQVLLAELTARRADPFDPADTFN